MAFNNAWFVGVCVWGPRGLGPHTMATVVTAAITITMNTAKATHHARSLNLSGFVDGPYESAPCHC
jgi:hypothetical protein